MFLLTASLEKVLRIKSSEYLLLLGIMCTFITLAHLCGILIKQAIAISFYLDQTTIKYSSSLK